MEKKNRDIVIVGINSLPNGSTGNIARSLRDKANKTDGLKAVFFSGRWGDNVEDVDYFGFKAENKISGVLSRFFLQNRLSFFGTLALIKKLKKIKPDIVHLHNLHLWVVNVQILFKYLKKNNIKVVWTLHDCWSFTGHCPHFTLAKCEKWKTGCFGCPIYKDYPQSCFDNSKRLFSLKKKWFTGFENMTIVTPSKWLAGLVGQSFLKDYPIRVINNGIDLNVFKPTESAFRKKHGIMDDEFMILGVAFGWSEKKGLDVFVELSNRLPERYKIVLVGTNYDVDKKLPKNIISVHRTHDKKELAEIYTAADLFVNPTREEVLGLVNVEALACGTPVVTFDSGGSPECIDYTCGRVVAHNDVISLEKTIVSVCEEKPFTKEACIRRAELFDMNERYRDYISLYKEIGK